MAVTLVEAAKLATDPLVEGVIQTFVESHPILARMPFEDAPGGGWKYNQEGVLPGIAFRGVNEAYTESAGVVNPAFDPLVIAGGDLDVDNHLIRTRGEKVRSAHVAMKIKALAHTIAHKMIKGDQSADPREFFGLQARLTGSQKIAAGSTSGGDALSLAKFDELLRAVDGANVIIMSKAMKGLLQVAQRTTSVAGYVTFDPQQFGEPVMRYNGIPIIEADPNGALYATLAFDEANPGGGSAVGTSIYAANLSEGMLFAIQNPGGMIVKRLGEQDAKPVDRTRVEWDIGMVLEHPRAAARLWGIKNAAIAA